MKEKKPWIEGSLEVLELAIEQYFMGILTEAEIDSDRYFRASLINADNAAELAVRVYIEYSKLTKAAINFFENLSWMRKNDTIGQSNDFKELEKNLRYHHQKRNTIYHQRYLMSIDRLDLLNCIFNVITLYKLLFPSEYEVNLERNLRRHLLIAFSILEKKIVNFCNNHKMNFYKEDNLQNIVLKMLESNLINDEIAQQIQEVLLRKIQLIPKTQILGEIENAFELASLIEDILKKIETNVNFK